MGTTGAGVTVYRLRSDADTLGIDTTLPGCEHLDVHASIDRYDQIWDDMLREAYPEITIEVTDRMGLRVLDHNTSGNPEDSAAAREVLAAAIEISDRLFNDGTLWAVDKTEVHCECGQADGDEPCAWSGSINETTVIEYMPQSVRSSQQNAGYSTIDEAGLWPQNGAVRLRVNVECAERFAELDAGWSREVEE